MKSRHEPFLLRSLEDLSEKVEELGISIPYTKDISLLFEDITINSKKIPNRFAVQPMEGADAETNGSPSELTFRRYRRYAEGGSGLIWFEATSVVPEGRSNAHQLMLNAQNIESFKLLVEQTRQAAHQEFGASHDVFLVLQLTHSGRYSKPEGKQSPLAAALNPYLDKEGENTSVISDPELDRLGEIFVEAACLAKNAGFDAVDVKACHGYLLNELLSAFTRKNSRYGESFENRIRFLTEVIQNIRIRNEVSGISTAVRLNVFDGIPYPYGFGVSKDSSSEFDLTEPKTLMKKLIDVGCDLMNITLGNPHKSPHFGHPFDRGLPFSTLPEEHPLEGISRLLKVTAELQKEFSGLPMVGTGYSWLRHFFPQVGAAVLSRREAAFIGLGRGSFAYPNVPKDLLISGTMNPKKTCITCSRCTELMRAGYRSGCVMRDKELYGKEYQIYLEKMK